ncbi:MAG: TolC family protein, partial [Spirochaetota bacterium]
MKHQGIPLLVLIAGMMVSAIGAQDQLTLVDAVAKAMEYNTSVRRQALALSTVEHSMDTAWNVLVPSLAAQTATSRSNLAVEDWTITGNVSASLTLSPAIAEGMKAKRLAYEAGTISLDQVKRETERSVRKLWYQLFTTHEQLGVLGASWSNAIISLEQTKTKQASGLASEIDLLNARIKAEDARLKVESAKTSYGQSIAGFRQLVGLPADAASGFAFGTLDVPESLNSPDMNSLTNDTIRALLTSLESARTTRALSYKQNFFPSLSL